MPSTNGHPKPGRPRKQIDENLLFRLARIHCTLPEIAAALDISVRTLRSNYCRTIKRGRKAGKASLRRVQYRMALKGNPTMAIWLGKQLLGQRDRHEHTADVKHEHNFAREIIEDPQARALADALERRMAGHAGGNGVPSN